ncbi:uncharacterized protein PgNI_04182 [Pyricularia grisea]|uniref:Uncharacterized protein n=1 Tax=Pyricularia grisea TaxID=148305 RepID=A0A6P8BB09_PYRGI|nr:uncharacterized protein PgNI_04182 [Pyricularia grisea]TLD13021.1 hypothetical protein PgNI_04182 [Pyricularia grisea]
MDYFDNQGRRPDDATVPCTDPMINPDMRTTTTTGNNLMNNNTVEASSQRRRNDGQFASREECERLLAPPSRNNSPLTGPASESWVEIASQPSSSSLSSIGDEIVTTGLRVHRRRHQLHSRQPHSQTSNRSAMPQSYLVSHTAARGNTSSQEDIGTESESDTSPLHLGSRQQTVMTVENPSSGYDDDDDDSGDENATALGRPAPPAFRPQPNAFSHPPSHLTHRHSTPSYSSSGLNPHERVSGYRSRRSSYSRGSHQRPNFMSPSYREDNDAALRASLTTLLSCAAAARALPKRNGEPEAVVAGPSSNVAALQPMGLRLVPETELMRGPDVSPRTTSPPEPSKAQAQTQPSVTRTPSSTSDRSADKVSKRSQKSASGPSRATKKKRTSESAADNLSVAATYYISPTLMTWVVGAGVVVLVSVVGFGAGYVIGREVGRQEGAGAIVGGVGRTGNATGSCGREIVQGTGTLRRFRWGSMGRSVVA